MNIDKSLPNIYFSTWHFQSALWMLNKQLMTNWPINHNTAFHWLVSDYFLFFVWYTLTDLEYLQIISPLSIFRLEIFNLPFALQTDNDNLNNKPPRILHWLVSELFPFDKPYLHVGYSVQIDLWQNKKKTLKNKLAQLTVKL